jgi:CMP-N-acetylneuraminic acid synthetase
MNDEFKDIAVVIPVREGSTRVKAKVLLPFTDEYNLTEWKIRQIKEVLPSNQIYLSTNSKLLKSYAKKQGISVHHRDDYYCDGHTATFSEVITHIVSDIPYKHIAWVTVVVPLMSPEEYKNAFIMYLRSINRVNGNDSLVSVNLLKEYLWNDDGPLNYRADKNHTYSQDLPNIYRVTNGLYMRDKKSILKDKYFLGTNPAMFPVSTIAGVDIDVQEEYDISRALLKLYNAEK